MNRLDMIQNICDGLGQSSDPSSRGTINSLCKVVKLLGEQAITNHEHTVANTVLIRELTLVVGEDKLQTVRDKLKAAGVDIEESVEATESDDSEEDGVGATLEAETPVEANEAGESDSEDGAGNGSEADSSNTGSGEPDGESPSCGTCGDTQTVDHGEGAGPEVCPDCKTDNTQGAAEENAAEGDSSAND